MHQNISLESYKVDRVHSLRKIPTRLRDTNFCTSSACFAPSSVRQPNGPKCIQIAGNTQERQFRVQWGVSGASVARNYDTTLWHELFTSSACFTTCSVRQPNGSKCTQIVQNTPKRQFRVQW